MGRSKNKEKNATDKNDASGKENFERSGSVKKSSEAKASKNTDKKQSAAQSSGGVAGKVRELRDFFEESKVELKKVTWPSRKETIATSLAVLVLTVVMALYLGVVDFGLSRLIQFILT